MRRTTRGFTLIETLIALAIATLLASIALPSFNAQLCAARRADALVAMIQVQAAQERLRSRATRYGSLDELNLPSRSNAGHYALRVAAFDDAGYTLTATATGVQASDSACRVMQIRAIGLNAVRSSGADESVANGASANRRCWGA